MSTSESSDSEPDDFDKYYPPDNVTLCEEKNNENLPEDQLEKLQETIKDTASKYGPTKVIVKGRPKVYTGPTYNYIYPPPDPLLSEVILKNNPEVSFQIN